MKFSQTKKQTKTGQHPQLSTHTIILDCFSLDDYVGMYMGISHVHCIHSKFYLFFSFHHIKC